MFVSSSSLSLAMWPIWDDGAFAIYPDILTIFAYFGCSATQFALPFLCICTQCANKHTHTHTTMYTSLQSHTFLRTSNLLVYSRMQHKHNRIFETRLNALQIHRNCVIIFRALSPSLILSLSYIYIKQIHTTTQFDSMQSIYSSYRILTHFGSMKWSFRRWGYCKFFMNR